MCVWCGVCGDTVLVLTVFENCFNWDERVKMLSVNLNFECSKTTTAIISLWVALVKQWFPHQNGSHFRFECLVLNVQCNKHRKCCQSANFSIERKRKTRSKSNVKWIKSGRRDRNAIDVAVNTSKTCSQACLNGIFCIRWLSFNKLIWMVLSILFYGVMCSLAK